MCASSVSSSAPEAHFTCVDARQVAQRFVARIVVNCNPKSTVHVQSCLPVGAYTPRRDGVPTWPYGNATSINPLLVTLGVSPGDSPEAEDDMPAPLELPPAGRPHSHVSYQDRRGYWDKIRHLARAMTTPPGGSETDAYALFGNMNLDPGRCGDAASVDVNRTFAEWVLRTIRWGLRPRWLVCLGLKVKLDQDRSLRDVFESIFQLNLRNPDEQYLLRDSRYYFREWELHTGTDHPLTVVFWPNHPSRHPFMDFSRWCDACEQFKVRHAGRQKKLKPT